MADVEPRRIRVALGEVDYPASKEALVEQVERQHPDPDVLRLLRALPLGEYHNEEVIRSVPLDPTAGEGRSAREKAEQARLSRQRPRVAGHLREVPTDPLEQSHREADRAER